MKQFNFDEFNKHATPFYTVSISFNSVDGLKVLSSLNHVHVSPQQKPADDCDFIAFGSSRCSEDFFELNGAPEINNLYFKNTYDFALKGFVYCLPENLDHVVEAMTEHYNSWIKKELQKQIDAAQKALSLVK